MALKNVKADKIGLQACLDALDAAQDSKQDSAFVADEATDWTDDESPASLQDALDQLASRLKALEDA